MKIPTIQTPHLILRGFTPDDFDPLFAILSNRDVIRYLPRTEPWPEEIVRRTMARQREHWEQHGFGWYAVECREERSLLGWCGLNIIDKTEEVEIKYLLKQSHWGRGLATEGATRCVQDGLQTLGLDEIIGLAHPDNIASQRVLEKAGLRYSNRAQYFGLDLLRYTINQPS
jgi:ribosomal-protein-alanine N-acetyltransferase